MNSVKERELPAEDDEFAQLASEFDTLDELKADLRERVGRVKQVEQAGQIRDKVLDELLEKVEVPLPEAVVQAEIDSALHDAIHELDHNEAELDKLLEAQGSSREEFDKEARESAERSVKTQLLLDAIAESENTTVEQEELTERIFFQAQRYGIPPEQFIQQISQANQLGAIFADVRRGKALGTVVDRSMSPTPPARPSTPPSFSVARRPTRMRLPRTPRRQRRRYPSSRIFSALSEDGRTGHPVPPCFVSVSDSNPRLTRRQVPVTPQNPATSIGPTMTSATAG